MQSAKHCVCNWFGCGSPQHPLSILLFEIALAHGWSMCPVGALSGIPSGSRSRHGSRGQARERAHDSTQTKSLP